MAACALAGLSKLTKPIRQSDTKWAYSCFSFSAFWQNYVGGAQNEHLYVSITLQKYKVWIRSIGKDEIFVPAVQWEKKGWEERKYVKEETEENANTILWENEWANTTLFSNTEYYDTVQMTTTSCQKIFKEIKV